jgi:murein DD-endopeptidase MepM/ murein hydrolase activator NlpD
VVVASPYKDPRRTGDNAHFGVDLAGNAGDVVRAPEAMTIVAVESIPDPEIAANTRLVTAAQGGIGTPFDGYGPGVVLGRGASGRFHLLAHVHPAGAAVGESVDEGDPVGELVSHVGAASPHVHWEVRAVAIDTPATREANTVDPMSLVSSSSSRSLVRPGEGNVEAEGLMLLALAVMAWLLLRR